MTAKKFQLHYAWLVCLCCTFIMFINIGITNTTFGVHLPYIISEHGFTNAQTSLIITIRTVVNVVLILLIDRVINKLGLRLSLLIGLACGAGGFFVFSFAKSLWAFYIGAVLIGIASGMAGFMLLSIILNNWFVANKGIAIGICSVGSGLTQLVLPSFVVKLVGSSGLSFTFLLEGILELVALVFAAFVIKGSPEEMHLKPLGNQAEVIEDAKVKKGADRDLSLPLMILLCSVLFIDGASSNSLNFFTIRYLEGGYADDLTAVVYSAIGIALIVSKLIVGRLEDKAGTRVTATATFSGMAAAIILLCFVGPKSVLYHIAAACLMGFGLTVNTIIISYLAVEFSTKESFTRVLKTINLFFFTGLTFFSYGFGYSADITGSYGFAYGTVAVLTVLAVVFINLIYIFRDKK